jgi:DNA-binding PadR family transcriptional regulator
MSFSEEVTIAGRLQWRVLMTFIEGPHSGAAIMRKLKLRSPGTIYPVIKTLREKGLIESAPERVPGQKAYVLSENGVREIKKILLTISRRYFSRYTGPYTSAIVDTLREALTIERYPHVLSTLTYEPVKAWLQATDATYLQLFDTPPATYDLVLSGLVYTIMAYGWKKTAFTRFLTALIESLRPGGTLILVELEQTNNLIVTMFFKDVLGFTKVPGVSTEAVRAMLEAFHLRVDHIHRNRGLLISDARKHDAE